MRGLNWTSIKLTEIDPHISMLSFNRPEKRNASSVAMKMELEECLAELKKNEKLRVLVLTGEGKAFCTGADLKERSTLSGEEVTSSRHRTLRIIEILSSFPVPVIAMVNGYAMAGGFEYALACDIRVSSDQAIYSLPEVNTAGAFPGAGGPVRLAKMVGRGRANLIVLTGRRFSAEEAFTLGFVEVVVPHEDLLARTLELARQIGANNPAGIKAVKHLILKCVDLDLHAGMDLSNALREPMDGTSVAVEGVQAWLEKRKPSFS